ncbi:hypothetical protein [Pseudonocardia nigra]|uniref:hypothetical protein n=1 Tax=Pseudonocardia nigra TaxID=1921578 RepID=UPI001C6039C8|nr:hypothetical protein [Pseudonocardia nigra]
MKPSQCPDQLESVVAGPVRRVAAPTCFLDLLTDKPPLDSRKRSLLKSSPNRLAEVAVLHTALRKGSFAISDAPSK